MATQQHKIYTNISTIIVEEFLRILKFARKQHLKHIFVIYQIIIYEVLFITKGYRI